MIINIQYDKADDLIRKLFAALPEEQKPRFKEQVDEVSSHLCYPIDFNTTEPLPYGLINFGNKNPIANIDWADLCSFSR